MKVSELMTKDPIFCSPSNSVRQVARMLRDHDIVLMPVIDDLGKLIGVVSDRDLCCRFVAEGNDIDRETIGAYITSNAITCRAEDDINVCEQVIRRHGVHRLPVINDAGQCVGIVAPMDLWEKPETVVSREFIDALRTRVAQFENNEHGANHTRTQHE
jgi:CBS domain-containing protein